MKKHSALLGLLILLASSQSLQAQKMQAPSAANIKRCFTVEELQNFRKKHPGAETDLQFETWLDKRNMARKSQRAAFANYTLPIIFHVVHSGEAVGTSPNISQADIKQQLLQLNKDFANQSNSLYGVAANCGIQFVLAQKDTLGNILTEPGIERINITSKGWKPYSTVPWTNAFVTDTVKPGSIWKPANYLNIWIVPSIVTGGSTLLGFATFPVSSTLAGLGLGETDSTAGVVIQSGTVGSVFQPDACGKTYGLGKTLTHELGHFFGLRHIWGDASCGNDFCDDTPIHQQSNNGIPQHPKSNTCGTADEMFENYMDYSDDIVLNTFTAKQVDRMQTVMLNSPRRVTLASSTVGAVGVSASNQISFTNCTGALQTSEQANLGNYPRYREINLTLNAEDKATANATVNIVATGTAINNLHYKLLTPSVSFSAGDITKNIKLQILDNAAVDGNKTIVLNYTIVGTGVTAGASAQSLTITIKDDDNIKIGSGIVTLMGQDFGSAGGTFPVGWLSGSFKTPAGPNKWKVGTNGGADISGQAMYITNNATTKPLNYTVDSASDAIVITPKINTVGYTNPSLSFTYKCNGEADKDGTYDYGELMYSYNNGSFYALTDSTFQGKTTARNTGNIALPDALKDTAFTIGFRWINDDNTGSNPPFLIDDVLVKASPFPIDTVVAASAAFDVSIGTDINHFKNGNISVIASIKNASTAISGLVAQVTQAGKGITPITAAGNNFLRSQKVFKLTPTVAYDAATYRASLYFTPDELAIWGTERLNLKVLKVKDGINLSDNLNASDVVLITPTVVEDTANKYITYNVDMTGFGQLVMVSAMSIVPIASLQFNLKANNKNIQLTWNTMVEKNNKGFAVERSTDGSNFTQIGFVNGAGIKVTASTYNYTDFAVKANVLYYYRLRQVDFDNRDSLSTTLNGKITGTPNLEMLISPNPAVDFVYITLTGTSSKADIELVNAVGQRLKLVTGVNAFDSPFRLNLSGLPKGSYTIVAQLTEGRLTKSIVVN